MQEWFTASELADLQLPAMPATKRGVQLRANSENWGDTDRKWHGADHPRGVWRSRAGLRNTVEYHFSLLPLEAQARLAQPAAAVGPRDASCAGDWEWYDAQTKQVKEKAHARLIVMQAVEVLIANGHTRDIAIHMAIATSLTKPSSRSVWRWFEAVAGRNQADWLPALAGRHGGGRGTAEMHPEAWEVFKAFYLRLEAPTLTASYRHLCERAEKENWMIPNEKSIARRIEREIHRSVLVLAREGLDALKRLVPPLKRDRSVFHALEALNGDGHKWDVFVRFDDGTIGRPMMVAFQDLYSNKMVGWRFDRSENREAIRLALGDVVEQFGLPQYIWFDNTRAFANKWLTGGASHRYRFKTRDEDPIGLCEQMGIKVHFTQPYSGQSKPIERSFRDFAQDIAKHPAFAGAYVGNNPLAKPENYGSRAIPFDDFVRIAGQEILKWNARPGRRTPIARGRSFDQVFAESYGQSETLIHKASAAMMRQWRLAAEGIRAHRDSGMISLLGNQFWSAWLSEHAGEPLVVRFDPQNVHAGVHAYAVDGRYLGFAEIMVAAGFNDVAAARRQAQLRNGYMRAVKAQLSAERSMDALKVAQQIPEPDLSEAEWLQAEHVVVHHVFRNKGAAALAAAPIAPAAVAHDQDAYMDKFAAGLRLIREDDEI